MRTLFSLAMALSPAVVFSQITITGKAVDSTASPVGFVTVTLYKDSVLLASALTDNMGVFKMVARPNPGTYRLRLSCIGFTTLSQAITITTETRSVILDKLVMRRNSRQLKEVSVSSQKPMFERKVDRLVFNVDQSMYASGSNAFEAISRTPGIIASGNSISMVGKGSLTVMIDGRLLHVSGDELYSYLNAIPSETIASIEVIMSPGAKYDANGDSGIINIVSKKNKSQGLVLFSTTTYEQRTNSSAIENINFNYRAHNYNLYGFTNLNHTVLEPTELSNVYYPTATWTTDNLRDIARTTSSYQLGFDIDLSKKSFLSIVTDGSFYNHSNEHATALTAIANPSSGQLDSTENLANHISRLINYKDGDIDYKLKLDTLGSYFSADLDYLYYQNALQQDLNSTSYAGATFLQQTDNSSQAPQFITDYAAKIDVVKKLRRSQEIDFGAKTNETQTDNDYQFFTNGSGVPDPANSDHFIYNENIQAVYASYSRDWKNFSLQAGLRGEYTDIKTESLELNDVGYQHYFKVFPSLFLMHIFDKDNRINFSYNVRINRPGYWELNPFKYYTSDYSYAQGNPQLRPSYAQNFQLVYTYLGKYFITPYFQLEQNHFQQVAIVNVDSNYYHYTRLNVGNITRYGLLLYAPARITSFWNLNTQVNLFSVSQDSPYLNGVVNYNRLSLYGNLNNQLQISKSKQIMAEFNITYSSPTQSFLYYSHSYYYADFGIRKLLANKRGSVGLNVSDIFHTYPYTISSNFQDQHSSFRNEVETRFVRAVFSYRFGSQTVKDRNNRNLGNSEEKGRLN